MEFLDEETAHYIFKNDLLEIFKTKNLDQHDQLEMFGELINFYKSEKIMQHFRKSTSKNVEDKKVMSFYYAAAKSDDVKWVKKVFDFRTRWTNNYFLWKNEYVAAHASELPVDAVDRIEEIKKQWGAMSDDEKYLLGVRVKEINSNIYDPSEILTIFENIFNSVDFTSLQNFCILYKFASSHGKILKICRQSNPDVADEMFVNSKFVRYLYHKNYLKSACSVDILDALYHNGVKYPKSRGILEKWIDAENWFRLKNYGTIKNFHHPDLDEKYKKFKSDISTTTNLCQDIVNLIECYY